MHTIIPAMGLRDGRCVLSFGVMGAHYQPMGHVHLITRLRDHGLDIQSAIDAPRAFFTGEKTQSEQSIPVETNDGLRARGHDVEIESAPWGGAQAIEIDWERGVLTGGSDPRKDGVALGY
jgi:gamma-glutamyltranspeptidase / glutathione hydrolase